jgi:hypothetical protein
LEENKEWVACVRSRFRTLGAEPLGAARRNAEGGPKGEPSGSERVQRLEGLEALRTIQESLGMEPRDKISQAIEKLVRAIISGKRPQPGNMADLKKR